MERYQDSIDNWVNHSIDNEAFTSQILLRRRSSNANEIIDQKNT